MWISLKRLKNIEVVGSIVDITELKKTEELLRKSEKLAVVGGLAAGIAHKKIRNSLTTFKETECGRQIPLSLVLAIGFLSFLLIFTDIIFSIKGYLL